MIETLEDVVEQIANWCGVYGSHSDDRCKPPDYCCRPCWTSYLEERIRAAVEVEQKLARPLDDAAREGK